MDILKDKTWMVKVPELVYNQIIKEKDIGYLHICEKNTNGNNTREIKVSLGGQIHPKNFEIKFDKTGSFYTFKDKKNQIKKVDYLGRFIASDEHVSDLMTLSVYKEELSNKPAIAIETGKGRPLTEAIIPLSEHQFFATNDSSHRARSQIERKEKHLKKTRMDREELKKEIFSLFTEKEFWANKELVAKLDQPENYLKEVLTEMCNYIRSGPKKGCYELKAQYVKTSTTDKMHVEEENYEMSEELDD
jgi:hypothetical protein